MSIGLVVFGLSGLLYFKGDNEGLYMVSVGMWRVGLTLGTLWLAFPQLADFFTRFPPILVVTYLVSLGIVAWRPRSLMVILPAVALLTLLHLGGFLLPQTNREKPHQR
jgi:hypothetical protein